MPGGVEEWNERGKRTLNPLSDATPPRGLDLIRPSTDTLLVRMSGNWRESGAMPPPSDVLGAALTEPRASRISFDTQGLTGWDSRLLSFLVHIVAQRPEGVELDRSGLPEGVRRLLHLAFATEKRDTGRRTSVPPWLAPMEPR